MLILLQVTLHIIPLRNKIASLVSYSNIITLTFILQEGFWAIRKNRINLRDYLAACRISSF